MDRETKKKYVPMTETGFYILFCLQDEMHGYDIMKKVRELTCGAIVISAGTMYGSLSKMEKDGLIRFTEEKGRRKRYLITEQGREVLETELKRIGRLYKNSRGEQA